MSVSRRSSSCRYCGSSQLAIFLSLGDQPPANNFLRSDQIASERRYPLDVAVCRECALVQLLDVVPPEQLFGDYAYLSSTSKALAVHYAALAQGLTERFEVRSGDVVVDIGCNDGVLLQGYIRPGVVRVGVEPSTAGELAEWAGLSVVRAFFGPEAVEAVRRSSLQAKIVTATNVFAHVDEVGAFTDGLPRLLREDGVFVIEAPYLIDLIDQTLFDTIYHEHLCYLSLTPLAPFLARHGLQVFDVERVNFGASGPALRVYAQRAGGPHPVDARVARLLDDEERWGVRQFDRYQDYAARVEAVKREMLALIRRLRARGRRLCGYGAPAKGNTLLNYLGITPEEVECIAETNPRKQHLLTPGTHIPVVSEEEFMARMPEYALLLSWNYLDHFLKKSEYIRRGGRFLVPLPVPRTAP